MQTFITKYIADKRSVYLMLVAVGFGILFNWFFYGNMLGIAAPIYLFLVCAVLVTFIHKRIRKTDAMLLLLIACFVVAAAVRASIPLTVLNCIAAGYVLLLLVNNIVGKKFLSYYVFDHVKTALKRPLDFTLWSKAVVAESIRVVQESDHRTAVRISKGIALAVPFIVLFGALFYSADLVFRDYVQRIPDIQLNAVFWTRALYIVVPTMFIAGSFSFVLHTKNQNPAGADEHTSDEQTAANRDKTMEVIGFLAAINSLFLTFIFVQFAYFFGGKEHVLSSSMTYSEYARKGFFELIAVAVISFLLIWWARRRISPNRTRFSRLSVALAVVMIAQVLVMLVSAFERLQLYESVFGFTQSRFYSHVIMIWLAVVFLLLVYEVASGNKERYFAAATVVSLAAFLLALNVINPERFIVQRNVARFNQTGELDVEYLFNLSADAVPQLVQLARFDALGPEKRLLIIDNIRYRNRDLDTIAATGRWQSVHVARYRARTLLLQQRASLGQIRKELYQSLAQIQSEDARDVTNGNEQAQ